MPKNTKTKKVSPPSKRQSMESGAIGKITDMIEQVQKEILDVREISLQQLIFMTRNDGGARGILNAIKFPIKMARPQIEEPKDAEGKAAKEVEFIRKNLLGTPSEGGMDTPMRTVITRMALAIRDGYKIFEKVWERRDGQIWLKKLAYRSTLCTKFKWDKHGNITGAEQEVMDLVTGAWRKIPFIKDKIAYYVYNAEENPYMGESAFLPVFYHYDKKHKLYAISHLAYQMTAIPTRVGYHPKTLFGESLDSFRDALKALGTVTSITVPDTTKIEPFESKRSLQDFLPLIQHHDSMMVRAFLVQFMNLGQEGRGGSFALSQDQSDLFLMSLMGLLEDIAYVFNTQVIPQLIDWNFGTKQYPKIVFTPFSDTLRSAVMETFRSLLEARFPQVSEEFILKLEELVSDELGMELDYDAIKERIEADKAMMQQMEADSQTGENKSDVSNISEPGKTKTKTKKAPGARDEGDGEL